MKGIRFPWMINPKSTARRRFMAGASRQALKAFSKMEFFDPFFQKAFGMLSRGATRSVQLHGRYLYRIFKNAIFMKGCIQRRPLDDPTAAWEVLFAIEGEDTRTIRKIIFLPQDGKEVALLGLSPDGGDPVEWSVFDFDTGKHVPGTFTLPASLCAVQLLDDEWCVAISADFGPGTTTTAGQARTARIWDVRTPIAEAEEIFRSDAPDDELVMMSVYALPGLPKGSIFQVNMHDFSNMECAVRWPGKTTFTPLPLPVAGVLVGYWKEWFFQNLILDWEHDGQVFPAGSILGYNINTGVYEQVFVPGPGQSIHLDAGVLSTGLLLGVLSDAQTTFMRCERTEDGWVTRADPVGGPGRGFIIGESAARQGSIVQTESWTHPVVFSLKTAEETITLLETQPAPPEAEQMETRRFSVKVHGREVVYFVTGYTHVLDAGNAPVILGGYGGFNLTKHPYTFDQFLFEFWLKRGGVFAWAVLPGDGIYGGEYRLAGKGAANRQIVVDSYLAVARALRGSGLAAKLGGTGASNGGLLVAIAANQAQKLFNAMLPSGGLYLMPYFHELGIGSNWTDEYGNPKKPEDLVYILKWSPVDNVPEPSENPLPMYIKITTSDQRVGIEHSLALYYQRKKMGHPTYLIVWEGGGHVNDVNPEKEARMKAARYAFFWQHLAL